MYCLHPINVRKYSEELDKFGKHKKTNEYHFVPCGKCVACLSRKRNELSFRLKREQDFSCYSLYVTLTYDQKFIPIKVVDNKPFFVFNKKHVQDYLKRTRYYLNSLNQDLKFSYYCVSEYGGKFHRPHYHLQIFVKNDKYGKYRRTVTKVLEQQWKFGFTVIKETNDANIHYVTKYCVKSLEQTPADCIDPVFMLCSKRPYLGSGAEEIIDRQFNDFEGTNFNKPVVFNNGYRTNMPRIYRNKLGIQGLAAEMSVDPRLTQKQYDEMQKEFFKTNQSQEKFVEFVNQKFKLIERNARLRQLNRSETL